MKNASLKQGIALLVALVLTLGVMPAIGLASAESELPELDTDGIIISDMNLVTPERSELIDVLNAEAEEGFNGDSNIYEINVLSVDGPNGANATDIVLEFAVAVDGTTVKADNVVNMVDDAFDELAETDIGINVTATTEDVAITEDPTLTITPDVRAGVAVAHKGVLVVPAEDGYVNGTVITITIEDSEGVLNTYLITINVSESVDTDPHICLELNSFRSNNEATLAIYIENAKFYTAQVEIKLDAVGEEESENVYFEYFADAAGKPLAEEYAWEEGDDGNDPNYKSIGEGVVISSMTYDADAKILNLTIHAAGNADGEEDEDATTDVIDATGERFMALELYLRVADGYETDDADRETYDEETDFTAATTEELLNAITISDFDEKNTNTLFDVRYGTKYIETEAEDGATPTFKQGHSSDNLGQWSYAVDGLGESEEPVDTPEEQLALDKQLLVYKIIAQKYNLIAFVSSSMADYDAAGGNKDADGLQGAITYVITMDDDTDITTSPIVLEEGALIVYELTPGDYILKIMAGGYMTMDNVAFTIDDSNCILVVKRLLAGDLDGDDQIGAKDRDLLLAALNDSALGGAAQNFVIEGGTVRPAGDEGGETKILFGDLDRSGKKINATDLGILLRNMGKNYAIS